MPLLFFLFCQITNYLCINYFFLKPVFCFWFSYISWTSSLYKMPISGYNWPHRPLWEYIPIICISNALPKHLCGGYKASLKIFSYHVYFRLQHINQKSFKTLQLTKLLLSKKRNLIYLINLILQTFPIMSLVVSTACKWWPVEIQPLSSLRCTEHKVDI